MDGSLTKFYIYSCNSVNKFYHYKKKQMKKIVSFIILIAAGYSISYSQVWNVNPDSNGEPWIVGGLRIPTDEELLKIPVLENREKTDGKELPSTFDNSTRSCFRPVFNQTDGSCGQASGVGYLFTYEINRLRGTSATTTSNQFPTHYTYNFLNGGSGSNGSWMTDGWEIIKASGCPTVATYGGIAATDTYWMSGYDSYTSGMGNRVKDMFAINVGTPEGLETLKYWIYDHLDGSTIGSIVNFAAGISNTGYETSGDIVTSWGYPINHAMTFTGWDDAVSFDYNNDGSITNTIDINGDQIVDMKDWERGALIMVNSWGTGWMNGGKAYVMYKLLADATDNGGIHANKVYGINVKQTQEPQLYMKVKMTHNLRNQIQIKAGISQDILAASPDQVLDFPLFNRQGGAFDMRGSGNTQPIEFALDITPLLNYVASGSNAKYFLQVIEDDPYSQGAGQIYDYSIVDASGNEYFCSTHNTAIVNNGLSQLSISAGLEFEAPEITTENLPLAGNGNAYSHQMEAVGGTSPYTWSVQIDYEETSISESFPSITGGAMTPNDYDDGYALQTIEFDFPFYGEIFNQFTVCTDGTLLFEEGFEYLRTEEAIMSTRMIGVFASDLMTYTASGDGMFYEGDENSATFRWKTSLFGNEDADIDVAVTLFPNGEMKFHYGTITEGIEWAAGISNGAGSYTIASLSGNYSPGNHAYKMSTSSFPFGMGISSDGLFSGTAPIEPGVWNINFKVLDNNNLASFKQLSFETIVTGTEENEAGTFQISPVPCNGMATISYQLDSETPVLISVYDVTGKLVSIVKNTIEKAGAYQIRWDTKEREGIYFIDLKTNQFHLTRQIVIVN